MTTSIDQTLHQFANLLPNWTLIPILTLLPNFGGFHRTLQRVRLANRGRLLLRTPGPVPFGTCICSNVETILPWTCHVYGPFQFRAYLGTSILLWNNIILEGMAKASASFQDFYRITSVVWLDYLLIVLEYSYFMITRETVKPLSRVSGEVLRKPRATVSQIFSST